MIRMRIGKDTIPDMDVYNKLMEYCKTLERKKSSGGDKLNKRSGSNLM
jgi:hypothetical protein